MAQVPYNPVPTTTPTEQGAPQIHVSTPEAAFGGDIARQTERLGGAMSQVGDELVNRAIAMQQLANETEAKNADIQFTIDAGKMHADYNSLQGLDRVNAFPKYSSDLQALYNKSRGALSNPMAQRMFDSSAVSVLNRSIFSGASAAGEANRQAALSSANAEFDLNTREVYANPDSENQFRAAIDQTRKTAAHRAALMPGGWSQETENLISTRGVSTLATNRVIGMAIKDPDKAAALFKQYQEEGLFFGTDEERAEQKVRSLTHTVGMTAMADKVMQEFRNEDGSFSKTLEEMQQIIRDRAEKKYADDPTIGTAAVAALDHNYNQVRHAQILDTRDVAQQINDQIVKGVTDVNALPPDVLRRMTPSQVKNFPQQVNSYIRAGEQRTNDDQYRSLLGLYNNDNGKFMDTDIMSIPGLSKSNINFFLGLQRKAAANGDPRVDRAMNWIRGSSPATLQELGIFRRNSSNFDDYDKFTGSLHEAIQAYQETFGKPPDEKVVTKEIFPTLIKQITVPGRWWGTNEQEFFRSDIPPEVRKAAQADSPGKVLTDEEVRHAYVRAQFSDLYGRQKKAKEQGRVGE